MGEKNIFEFLSVWSEVWALLIPLTAIIINKPRGKRIRFLVWYVFIGFTLNFAATFMLEYPQQVPTWAYIDKMANNNVLYNIHSIIRVLLFSWYIITTREYRYSFILKILLGIYLVFVLYNFMFYESVFFLSTRLFASESILLLAICFAYFFRSINDESETNWLKHPSFLVCAGISLYEIITFFIFLFFYPLNEKDPAFFVVTMEIYHITFVLLCILLALAFKQNWKNDKMKSSLLTKANLDIRSE